MLVLHWYLKIICIIEFNVTMGRVIPTSQADLTTEGKSALIDISEELPDLTAEIHDVGDISKVCLLYTSRCV